MTWYPEACEFFIGGPKKHAKRIGRVALVLSKILPYCWNDNYESRKGMDEYIQNVLRAAGVRHFENIVIKVREWSSEEGQPLSYRTECETWCNFSEMTLGGLHTTDPIDKSELKTGVLDEIIESAYYSGEIHPEFWGASGGRLERFLEQYEVEVDGETLYSLPGSDGPVKALDIDHVPRGAPLGKTPKIYYPPNINYDNGPQEPLEMLTEEEADEFLSMHPYFVRFVKHLFPYDEKTLKKKIKSFEKKKTRKIKNPYYKQIMQWCDAHAIAEMDLYGDDY